MMKQVKCPKCNKTLFRVYDNEPYKIEIKCPRCKAVIVATEFLSYEIENKYI